MALNLELDGHLVMLILMIIFKLCDDWLQEHFYKLNNLFFLQNIFLFA